MNSPPVEEYSRFMHQPMSQMNSGSTFFQKAMPLLQYFIYFSTATKPLTGCFS
ncbi:hypothetical protein [Cesiribacter sp. SM1]|uniref:hypothetical protein n=1 Tax=Cesiribacter sp. SM1 TaxID=2861196 RepID=UPI001CD81AB3|nr:hypothetical protein [Cesiribacter sp. SM1]